MKKELAGTIFALIAAVISGFSILANKIFIVDMEPAAFTALRALIIGIIFFVVASFQCKFRFVSFKKVSWKYLLSIAVIGGSFAFLFFFTGLKITTGGRAAFLQKTLPLFVAVFAFLFLKEKLKMKHVTAMVVMFAGIVMIYFTAIAPAALWLDPSLGDMLVIGATVLWAAESIIAKKAIIKGETSNVVSFARMFFGSLILFAVIVLLGKTDALILNATQLFNVLMSTLILLGYVFFWFYSMKFINVSKAATLLLIAPVVSLILGVFVLSEPAPLLQIAGSALILIGACFIIKMRSELATGV